MRRILLMLLAMTLLFLASCSSPEAQPPAAEPPAAEPSETEPPVSEASITDASNKEPAIVYVDPEKAFAIYVNDEKIAQAAVYNEGDLEIPILAVLKGLGATVTWLSPEKALALYQEKEITIDTTNKMIYIGGEEFFCPPVGGLPTVPYIPVYRKSGAEIFVDQRQLDYFFRDDLGASLTFNYVDKEVYVQKIIA